MPTLCNSTTTHCGLTMGVRFDATRLQVPGTEMQVRTGDCNGAKARVETTPARLCPLIGGARLHP